LTATGFTGPLTGNASTATLATTARAIGGVNFDGSAAINLPGVNTAGNQATSGLAATATALATARTIGGTSFDGSANIVPATVTVADTTDTSSYVALFESATGDLGPKTDAGVTYNAGTGMLTATGFTGPFTGNASTATLATTARAIGGVNFDGSAAINLPGVNTAGNQATSGLAATATALATARTIGGTSFDGSANIVPATVTVADTTDTSSYVALFESATGDLGPKTDAGVTYNAGTGMLTATGFTGPFTGNASGTAATVTTAAQPNITSVGTLTTLTVDNVIVNGTTIGHTSDDDLITLADGLVTVAGEISVTTLDIGGTNVVTDISPATVTSPSANVIKSSSDVCPIVVPLTMTLSTVKVVSVPTLVIFG
jgi:hypothetical protein